MYPVIGNGGRKNSKANPASYFRLWYRRLHRAFVSCENAMEFWDNSLLSEMKGWVRETLINNEWQIIDQEEYSKAVETLEAGYDYLPKQLIHRDVPDCWRKKRRLL